MSLLRTGAIIVAAGDSRRFCDRGEQTKKQFAILGNKPLFLYSVKCFIKSPLISKIIVVVSPDDIGYCTEQLWAEYGDNNINVIAGGSERQESVYNAFLAMRDDMEVVVIHDGARPFLRSTWIDETIKQVETYDGAIVALPSVDTLKYSQNNVVHGTLDRSEIWQAQTPQTFRVDILDIAFNRARQEGTIATDEAQLVEHIDGAVVLVKGSPFNMKVTTKSDLILAESILSIKILDD